MAIKSKCNVIKDFEEDKSFHTYRTLLSRFPLKLLEEAVLMTHIGHHYDMDRHEIIKTLRKADSTRANEVLEQFVNWCEGEQEFQGMVAICQYAAQVERWKRNKQCYVFDRDFVAELADTDTHFVVPYDIFDRMPHKSVYLDYSANEELCEAINVDGVLVQVEGVRSNDGQNEDWVFLILAYRNGCCVYTVTQIIPNVKGGNDINIDDVISAITTNRRLIEEKGEAVFRSGARAFFSLVVQSVMYLCSYEPDIRESAASKQQYRKAKKTAKNKAQLPEREHEVGERFGEAFRKWTRGTLGRSHEGTGTGSKKRPHLRRAHWHRFWKGKRNSDERELIVRWVSECYCGITESEAADKLDIVSHKSTQTAQN